VITKEGGGYKGGRDRNRKVGRGQEWEGGKEQEQEQEQEQERY
jgi:hypothetical protein